MSKSSAEREASDEPQNNVSESQANADDLQSEITSNASSAENITSDQSQNNVIDVQANDLRQSDSELESQYSKILNSNESAPKRTENELVATRIFYSKRGNVNAADWFTAGYPFIQYSPGCSTGIYWMHPVPHSSTAKMFPSTQNQYDFALTELPQYGGRKSMEYEQYVDRSKTTTPCSKPALAIETSLQDPQAYNYNGQKTLVFRNSSRKQSRQNNSEPVLETTNTDAQPISVAKIEDEVPTNKSDSNITERNIPETLDNSSRFSYLSGKDRKNCAHLKRDNSDLLSSQESSTSDLTSSERSSTSDFSSFQSFDLSDNSPAPKNKSTGAIKKTRGNVRTETDSVEYRAEGRGTIAGYSEEDAASVSSCNTVRPTETDDPYNLSDHTLRAHSDEEHNWEEDGSRDTMNSNSTETFNPGASTSGISSGVTSSTNFDEIPLDEESQSSYGNRVSHFNINLHNKLRYMKTLLAAQAFQKITVCNVDLPLELRRTQGRRARIRVDMESLNRNNVANNNRAQKQMEPDRAFFQSIPSDPLHNVTVPIPRLHNGVATIERLEDILEMLLTIGYKISKDAQDAFGNQQVPSAIHNAMSDVKTFLEPIKAHIETTVQDEYLRPLMDSVQDVVTPIFHHLNDSVIALESPATPLNYLPLKLVGSPVYDLPPPICGEREESPLDAVEEIYEMATYDRSIISQAMHTFDHSTGFRAPFHRPGINRAHVVPLGLIEIPFHHDMLVIITLDLGIIVINKTEKVVAAISADGYLAGFKFCYGECLQTGTLIDVSFYNEYDEIEKRAKISPRGITFQDEYSPTTYLITTGNIATCQSIFSSLTDDFLGRVLYSGSRYGPQYIQDCVDLLNFSKSIYDEDGTITWVIQNLKIKQNPDGQIILHKNSADYTIIMTPGRDDGQNENTHTARLTTPEMHVTCSMTEKNRGNTHHMYIRQDAMKIFRSEQKFIVRNYTQSAGIDKTHKIYLNAS